MIKIYTDGSSRGNPGPGGFGVIAITDNKILYDYNEQCENTTNNREELKAIIHAMKLAKTAFPEEVCYIISDSAYCVNMCNIWIRNWARNNWKNSQKKIVENLDLVKLIYDYIIQDFNNFEIQKIEGHAGAVGNELADALATNNINKYEKIIKGNNLEL